MISKEEYNNLLDKYNILQRRYHALFKQTQKEIEEQFDSYCRGRKVGYEQGSEESEKPDWYLVQVPGTSQYYSLISGKLKVVDSRGLAYLFTMEEIIHYDLSGCPRKSTSPGNRLSPSLIYTISTLILQYVPEDKEDEVLDAIGRAEKEVN